MISIAENLWLLDGRPPYFFNVYLAGNVLVDTGSRFASPRILRQLRDRAISMVALTHCHPDHQGSADAVCRAFGVPLACPAGDVPAMEGRQPMYPRNPAAQLVISMLRGPFRKVDKVLHQGDMVGEFRVIDTPGHTPGHCSLFRDSDRVLIAGDVLANINWLTGGEYLREPPHFLSSDFLANRRSMHRLLELNPSLMCFGHGRPLHDMERLLRLLKPYLDR